MRLPAVRRRRVLVRMDLAIDAPFRARREQRHLARVRCSHASWSEDRMPRSSLLNALMRIAADVDRAQRPARPVGWGPKIERRAALRGAASLAGMALLPRLPALAAAEARVAIVGAGLAGLTAAYELSKVGLKPDVYEGSTRLGGRCYSIRFSDRTDRRAWRRVH